MDDPTLWHLDVVDWTAVTGLATVGLVLTAIGAGIVAYGQLRDAKSTRHEEQRAYVSADFESHATFDFVIEFVIRNSGRTPATDITFEWDQPPERAVEGLEAFVDARLFAGIPTLAPNREIRIMFDTTLERFNQEKLPRTYVLKIGYTDLFGARHIDKFVLDAELRRDTHSVGVKTTHDIGKALEKMAASQLFSREARLTTESLKARTKRDGRQQYLREMRYEKVRERAADRPDLARMVPPASLQRQRPKSRSKS